jgi:hypothetical protein
MSFMFIDSLKLQNVLHCRKIPTSSFFNNMAISNNSLMGDKIPWS